MMKTKAMLVSMLFCSQLMPAMAQHASQSMTLKQLFELVERNSKQLQTQRTGIEIANQAVAVAKSRRLPDINTQLQASYLGNALLMDRDFSDIQGLHCPHLGTTFSLEASQVIYAGGALNAGIALSELQKQKAEAGLTLSREQLRFLTLGQYLDLYKIDNRMRVYESNIALTQTLIGDIKAKQTQGMALKNDVTRYELQMETLKLGLVKLKNQRSIYNHQLCNTLGLPEQTVIEPDASIIGESFERESEAYWQNQALASSPVLQQSELDIKIAEQNKKLAKSALLPKVALVAGNNFDGPITFELPPINKNLNIWYVGVGVKYSLSSLFKSNKSVRQAETASRLSREVRHVAAEDINNAVQAAHTYYLQSYTELATQQKSVQLAAQNYTVMNERYLNQLALVTDMVDASNIKLNAELLEVDARINIVYAYYRMKYAAGTL